MFNVTIINVKKSIRNIAILLIVLTTLFFITKILTSIKSNKVLQTNISVNLMKCLNVEIPAMENTFEKVNTEIIEDGEEDEESLLAKLLSIELSQIQEKNVQEETQVAENTEQAQIQEQTQEQVQEQQSNSQEVQTNVATEVVTQNPISESYNVECNGVKIKNETSFEINSSISENQTQINKNNVLIFHTHTCESYTPSEQYQYQQTGNFRTTDLNFNVSRVGDELTNYLQGFGFSVTHDKTYHDYPAYSGSYNRSLTTVQNALKTTPSDIIIDLHRDAIGNKSNYDPSVKIGEDVAAQLMFVIGTNGGGLYHPNWQSNLKFAIEIQQKANEMYPGLFKPIIVRNSRYNQHLGSAACIIEVGATGNTLEQCMASMKYLAKVLDEYKKAN